VEAGACARGVEIGIEGRDGSRVREVGVVVLDGVANGSSGVSGGTGEFVMDERRLWW